MNKKIVATSSQPLSSTAAAQSMGSYSILDAAIERVNNAGAAGDSVRRAPNRPGEQLPTRQDFRSAQLVGDELSVAITLDGRIARATATLLQSGRPLGDQAFVGLQNCWGTQSSGRCIPIDNQSHLNV